MHQFARGGSEHDAEKATAVPRAEREQRCVCLVARLPQHVNGCSPDDSRRGADTIAQDRRGRVAGLVGFLGEHVHPVRRVEAGARRRARDERRDGLYARVVGRCEYK